MLKKWFKKWLMFQLKKMASTFIILMVVGFVVEALEASKRKAKKIQFITGGAAGSDRFWEAFEAHEEARMWQPMLTGHRTVVTEKDPNSLRQALKEQWDEYSHDRDHTTGMNIREEFPEEFPVFTVMLVEHISGSEYQAIRDENNIVSWIVEDEDRLHEVVSKMYDRIEKGQQIHIVRTV